MDRKSNKANTTRPSRSKKRSFSGNQFTSERDVQNTSASAQKIARVADDFEVNIDQTIGYFIVNFALFLSLQDYVICKICKSNIKFYRRFEKGLGFQLVVKCECDTEVHIPSSPT